MTVARLDLNEIRAARARLGQRIVTTPAHRVTHPLLRTTAAADELWLKLELLQVTGSFKVRAALLHIDDLSEAQRSRGVTAISAGNHAIAVAYAAREAGISARIVMTSSANPARVAACRAYGADLVFAPDIHQGFELGQQIAQAEGRVMLHPFEGRRTALATATVGLELCEQVPALDAVVVPIGGGGLAAGVASAVKLLAPGAQVIGVEPWGADTMYRSLAAGRPVGIDSVDTIADSLGAPYAMPESFELCRHSLDRVVRVTDDELRASMRRLAEAAKLAVEPAAAASLAALSGPLRGEFAGGRVGLILCGSNIDVQTFCALVGGSVP
jgi:threonine dehydratase